MHSAMERISLAANRLPPQLKQLYLALFHEDETPEQICDEAGISREEFEQRRSSMMRSLMAAAAPARSANQPGSATAPL